MVCWCGGLLTVAMCLVYVCVDCVDLLAMDFGLGGLLVLVFGYCDCVIVWLAPVCG